MQYFTLSKKKKSAKSCDKKNLKHSWAIMITNIKVDGFKTLSDFELSLNHGLNVLVGPNGSGKTNIISFFEFLAHLIDNGPAEATSHLGGAGAVFRRVAETYQANISATITGCYQLNENLAQFHIPNVSDGKDRFAFYEYSFTLLFSNELESVIFTKQRFCFKHSKQFILADEVVRAASDWGIDIDAALDSRDATTKVTVRKVRGEFSTMFPFFPGKDQDAEAQVAQFLTQVISPSTSIPSILFRFNPHMLLLSHDIAGGQTYNIIPSRVKLPEDSAKPPGIASDGSGLSSTLYSLKRRNVTREFNAWIFAYPGRQGAMKAPTLDTLKRYFQLANTSIEDVDVANDSFSNQLRVSFLIKNGDYSARVPLSLMSDGTLKWLTLLTAALTASSVFSIEEPENYLHPQMQGQFVKIIREILFKEKTRAATLMSTHSETLLNHCKPSELVVVALRRGKTMAYRCKNQSDLSDEIEKTGFGLGYYYIAGAIDDDQ